MYEVRSSKFSPHENKLEKDQLWSGYYKKRKEKKKKIIPLMSWEGIRQHKKRLQTDFQKITSTVDVHGAGLRRERKAIMFTD